MRLRFLSTQSFFRASQCSFPASVLPLSPNGSWAIVKTRIFRRKPVSTTSIRKEERRHGPVYYWQEYVEDLEKYRPGGFHPVLLGDEFLQGRYRVVHKLGWGAFSTIWLVRDEATQSYVGLKILSAAKSKTTIEIMALNALQGYGELSHPGRPYVLRVLDQFEVEGPNGKHKCIVSEVVGCNLHHAKLAGKRDFFPLQVAKRAAAQLALGLAYIHSCRLMHGDLHPANLAFSLPKMDSWTVEQLYERLGQPETCPITRLDEKPLGPEAPPYVVKPIYPYRLFRESDIQATKIIDFGEASFIISERRELRTPWLLRPPESFFYEKVGKPADVWTFACTVFGLFARSDLLEAFEPDTDSALYEMMTTLGHIPERWWEQWYGKFQFFESDKSLRRDLGIEQDELEEKKLGTRIKRLRQQRMERFSGDVEVFTPEDTAGLQQLLEATLRYEPSDRATAEGVLQLSWMQELIQDIQE